MKLRKAFLLLALAFSPVFAWATNGNIVSQEVGDVVFRSLDYPLGLLQDHAGLYIGQSNKAGLPETPLFHKVIQMTGIRDKGWTMATWYDNDGFHIGPTVTMVGLIEFVDFDDFQRAHPYYFGAFTLSEGVSRDTRAEILETAQVLSNRELYGEPDRIKYVVMRGESALPMVWRYFTTKNDLSTYGEKIDIGDIDRMRCDAFTEYAYAAAGLPIARGDSNRLLNLTKRDDAKELVKKAAWLSLYPTTQRRDWMKPSQTENPTLALNGAAPNLVDNGILNFDLADLSSGPGLFKIYKYSEYGVPDVVYSSAVELMRGESIQTANIASQKLLPLSEVDGISPGQYTATVYDHAGNAASLSFSVAGGPEFSGPYSTPLYQNFYGDSAFIPSTIERNHSFSFSDKIAGVTSVLMTGPPGNVLDWAFDPPISSTKTSLANMAPGQYSVKIINSVGNETNALFNIGNFNVAVSTPGSSQVLSFPSDPLAGGSVSVAVRADVEGFNELDRIELTDPLGRVLETQSLSGYAGTVSFALPALALPEPLYMTDQYPAGDAPAMPYALKLWDKKGNYKRDFFTLSVDAFTQLSELLTPTAGAALGAVVDTTAYDDGNGVVHSQPPGALVSSYSVSRGTDGVLATEQGYWMQVQSWAPAGEGGITDRQNIGAITIKVRTGDLPDLSDAAEHVILVGQIYASSTPIAGMLNFGGAGTLYLSASSPARVPAKRYIQAKLEFQKASPGAFLPQYCSQPCEDMDDPGTCRTDYCYKGLVPELADFRHYLTWGGMMASQVYPANDYNAVGLGQNVRVDLAGGAARLDFTEVTAAGQLSATAMTVRPPSGFLENPSNVTYEIVPGGGLAFAGATKLTLKYDPAGLTPEQIGWLKIVRVVDPAAGKYEIMGGAPGANNTITADITQLGRYIVAVPEYASPKALAAQNLEFLAGETVTSEPYDMATPAGQSLLAAMKSRDLMPVGPVTRLGPDGLALEPSGAVTMRYSDGAIAALGVDENSIAIYQFTADGGSFARLPYLTRNTADNVLTARVPGLTSLFAILASSRQVENIPPSVYPDGIPPESSLAANGPAIPAADGIIVSTRTGIALSGADPVLPGVETSGYKLTNYLLNPDENTVDISTFTAPLVSSEGVHALHYFSVDNALNYEFPRGTTIYADGTPPVTMLGGETLFEAGGKKYAAAGSSVTLNGKDILSNGVSSGHLGTLYLVGISTSACPALAQIISNPPAVLPTFAGLPGSCENPAYSQPFSLEEGTRSVTYFSQDRVGNSEKVTREVLYVDGTAPSVGLLIDGILYEPGAEAEVVAGSSITIPATDLTLGKVASGLATTYMLINVAPETCESGGAGGGVDGVGSCGNPYYTGAFSLPVGTHTVYYSAMDRVGNKAPIKRIKIAVHRKAPFPIAYKFTGKFALNNEYFAAIDAVGNIYAASFNQVSKYTSSGILVSSWGTYGSGPGQFLEIGAIKVGPDGSIYVLDISNKSVQKFTPDGTYLSAIKGVFQYPQGFDIGKNGDLYVADYTIGQVVVVSASGEVLKTISVPNCLDALADDAGNVYAADNLNKVVKKFSPDGTLLTTFGSQAGPMAFEEPFSLALDGYGNIFVTDLMSVGARIAVFRGSGEYLGEIGTTNTTPGGVMSGIITRPALNSATGELFVPQGTTLFSYQIPGALTAPRVISPASGATISHEQVLVYIQAEPGAKVEVLAGGATVVVGYVDNAAGWFKTSVALAQGPHAISVRAATNMGFDCGTSPVATISVQAQQPAVFSQAVSIPVRGYPYTQVIATTTVTGDFNGDHQADIVAIGKYSYTVLLGRGGGNFDEQLSVGFLPYYFQSGPTGTLIWEALADDVNKDGKLDFVLSSLGSIIAALGNGDGTFRLQDSGYSIYTCNQQNIGDMDIELGDLNGDGRTDIIKSVNNNAAPGSCVYVFTGLGDGKFYLSAQKYVARANDLIALKDLDSDGKPDITTGQGIYWNGAAGPFENFQEMCSSCTRVLTEDMTGDGLPDLLFDYKQLRVNAGGRNFGAPVVWNLDWQGNWILGKPAVRDFNGDGVPDIALGVGKGDSNYGWIFAYLGYGDGLSNPTPVKLYVGNTYSQIDTLSVADFNNDAHGDIVTALHFNIEYLTPELALFLNNTQIADVVPPAASTLGLAAGYDGGVRVAWTAPGDNGAAGKAARYELAFSPASVTSENFSAATKVQGLASPKPAGSAETANVTGLEEGGLYYFALVSYDEAGNASQLSNVPSIQLYYSAESGPLVGGRAEALLVAGIEPALAAVSAEAALGLVAVEAAAAQDLALVSGIHSVGFAGGYDFSGVLSLRYSTAAVESKGLIESDVAIYEYSVAGWSRMEGQILDSGNKTLVVPVNSSSVVCGVLGSGPKLLSPAENSVIYSTSPVFLGRICGGCALRIYESGALLGEMTAQEDGFLKGALGFAGGRHSISAEVVEGGIVRPVKIYREFSVQAPYALGFEAPVMMSSNAVVNMGATGIGVADFNGDGHDDILVFGKKGYVTALGRGNGGFDYKAPVSGYYNGVFRIETPDLNKDGKPDIVAANYYKGVLASLGNGDGSFGGIYSLPNQLSVSDDIASRDFDGDSFSDVAIAGYDTSAYKYVVSLLKGEGGPNFSRRYLATPLQVSAGVKFAQMDVDGKTDILHGGAVLYGDGQGNFPVTRNFAPNCVKSLTGDFNKDGYGDFACIRNYETFADIYVSLRNRTYKLAQTIALPAQAAEAAALADMNNDGHEDLVLGGYYGRLYVLASRGDGSFSAPVTISIDSRVDTVKTVKIGDFDEDGRRDIVVGHHYAPISPEDVTIIYNRSAAPDVAAPGTVSNLGAVFDSNSGDILLSWTAPGDDGARGIAAQYDLRFAAVPVIDEGAFNGAFRVEGVRPPAAAGTQETFALNGLAGGNTYYFALKAADESGNVSAVSNGPGVFVLYVAKSTGTIEGGRPELGIVSSSPAYIIWVSTVSGGGAVVVGSASALGITLGSNLYEIGPDGAYNPPAILTFYYSTAALAAAGLQEEDVYVYEHFPDGEWKKLPDQVRDILNHKITVPITQIASLFGVFGVVSDRTAPATELSVKGSSWSADGQLYVSSVAALSLNAYDAVVYGTSSGVAFTGFRVDAGSAAPFAMYAGPFALAAGPHLVEFFSRDNAGNDEQVRSAAVLVDSAAPASLISGAGRAGENGWHISAVAVSVKAEDAGSGVAAVNYSLDGDAYQAYSSLFSLAAEGGHAVAAYAIDHVGNEGGLARSAFKIDLSTPGIYYSALPVANSDGWNKTLVEVVFTGTDAVSGVEHCSSSFTLSGEGKEIPVSGYCRDFAGWSSTAAFSLSIDTTAPGLSYAAEPAANGAGWNNSDVTVKFACSDALSAVKSCPADEVFSGEGLDISTSAFALDYAGNSRSVVVAGVKIDKTAPAVVVVSPAAGGSYVAGKGTVNIGFSVADNLDQAPSVSASLVQALDKGAPRGELPASVTVVSGQALDPMTLDDGLWRLEVVALDAADNSTRAVSGLFEVVHDTIAPLTTLNVGEPKFAGEAVFINSATPLLLSATDDMLIAGDRQGAGVEFTYASIDGGAEAVITGPLNILSEGLHTLAYYSVDKAGNAEPAKTAAFSVDNTAPEAEYTITGPVFQGGRLFASTSAMIALSAVEPPSSGAASGLATIFVADSTDTYAIYAGIFTAAEGAHLYGYYAKDRLGNASQVKTLALVADGTPPATEPGFSIAPSTETPGRLTISSDTYVWLAGTDEYSGIAAITYSIDGFTPAVFCSSFTLAPGPHSVAWWSVDNVGNTEPTRTAAIQVRGQTALAEVALNFEPSVINLKSEGKYVEARLAVFSATGPGFDADSIRITKVNDVALSSPLYALFEHGNGKKEKSREKLFSVTVKFDRQALIAVLPPDAESVVTMEGPFDDSTTFVAEGSLRVMAPGRISKSSGGKVHHGSKAAVDIPAKSLKEDSDISVVAMYERQAERREREDRAAAKGLTRKGGIYEFGPEGTVFDEPVEISLPYENNDAAKEKLSVAYWNPSSKDWEPLASTLDPIGKVVKAKVGHFSLYQVVASTLPAAKEQRAASAAAVPEAGGPSSAFLLGEVYVYPNPAKGAEVPVFHVECGIADSVNIKVYTVSGREAHEATLAAMPAILDDGNGASYAYEYSWRGHIPSGIYLYYIEARKGGQKIKKTGKFAVVR